MDYNLGQLRTAVKDIICDDDYGDSKIDRAINYAYLELLGEDKYKFLEKVYRIKTLHGGNLDLPRDYQTTIAVKVKVDNHYTPLKYISPQVFLGGGGKPHYCYTVYSCYLIVAIPTIRRENQANTSQPHYEIVHYYLSRPQIMTEDTDVPVIPEEFSEVIVYGTVARIERRRGNFDYAQIYENKLDDLSTNMKLRYGVRQSGSWDRARQPLSIRIGV
jgi:hypothetical protein